MAKYEERKRNGQQSKYNMSISMKAMKLIFNINENGNNMAITISIMA